MAVDAVVQETPRFRPMLARRWDWLPRGTAFLLGVVILGGIIALSLLAPVISPYDPIKPDYGAALLPPSSVHLFGTDNFGRDIFTRTVYAARIDLELALPAVPAKGGFESALGSGLANLHGVEAQDRIVVDGELLDPADVTGDMAHRNAVIVVASPCRAGLDARKLRSQKIDGRHLIEGEVARDRERRSDPELPRLVREQRPLLRGQRHDVRQKLQALFEIAAFRMANCNVEALVVGSEQDAAALHQPAALRRQELDLDPVVVGQRRVALPLEHLNLVEPRAEQPEATGLGCAEKKRAACELRRCANTQEVAPAHRGPLPPMPSGKPAEVSPGTSSMRKKPAISGYMAAAANDAMASGRQSAISKK